ncbi:piggyBac transposable element-derived protein 3-like [Vespa crabro]|uniref:piggyBac transposable element-derived protein 3-like n=1 Tax=Vespa crabro TaxID=7445 RepID=UPI001F00D48B|nr:piggyBac transposable element-derived protein 3-like [Vespa crabro]
MNTKSHRNNRGITIRRVSGNSSDDSLLDSESDEDVIVSPRRRINVIDSDEEFSTQFSSDEEDAGDCPKVPEAPHSSMTYFRQQFDKEIISNIVDYTNMYALQYDPAKPIAVSVNEIEYSLAAVFFMSIYGLLRTEMYWNSKTRVSAVADTMSRTRWREIKSKIHFSRNLQANATNNAEVTDSLQKIRPILDKLVKNFNRIPMSEHVCVDEQIIPFKGRHRLKNYMPKKSKKWGYKAFLLCDSSGLIYNFEIYTGKVIRDPELPNVGSSGNMVLRLAKIIPKQLFYKICFDNWFSTLPLVFELEKLGIQSVATVRVTINAVKWYDNKAVHLISTFCEIEPVDIVKRWDKKVNRMIDVQRPNIVKTYNQHMGGINLVDSLIALYRIKIRSKKWYCRIKGVPKIKCSKCNVNLCLTPSANCFVEFHA